MQLPQRRQRWLRQLRQRRQNYPGSVSLLPRSRKKRHAARAGPIEAGTMLTRGAGRLLITDAGAATATNDQGQAGEHAPPVRRLLNTMGIVAVAASAACAEALPPVAAITTTRRRTTSANSVCN